MLGICEPIALGEITKLEHNNESYLRNLVLTRTIRVVVAITLQEAGGTLTTLQSPNSPGIALYKLSKLELSNSAKLMPFIL